MTSPSPDSERTLRLAEHVIEVLRQHQIDTVMIGALALAVHRYPRDTTDLDLAVAIDPRCLTLVADDLRAAGYDVEVHEPDASDPLGGVVDVRASGADLVQIVNFLNPPAQGFPRLVADAVATATEVWAGHTLKVVDLPHLVAFKLYAGGRKSELDVLELIDRNPELDFDKLRELCCGYGLERALDDVMRDQR